MLRCPAPRQVVAYRVDVLTPSEFSQTEIPLHVLRKGPGTSAWDGMRRHHMDAHQVGSSAKWEPAAQRAEGLGNVQLCWCLLLPFAFLLVWHGAPVLPSLLHAVPSSAASAAACSAFTLWDAD